MARALLKFSCREFLFLRLRYPFHYQTTDELNEHLQAFLLAYNHAKRLKALCGLTPHEFIGAQWQNNPTIFTRDPIRLTLGRYR